MELTTMSAPNMGVIDNAESIMYPACTADWGTLTHYVLYDENGTVLLANKMEKPRIVQEETQFYFKPHALKFSLIGD